MAGAATPVAGATQDRGAVGTPSAATSSSGTALVVSESAGDEVASPAHWPTDMTLVDPNTHYAYEQWQELYDYGASPKQ